MYFIVNSWAGHWLTQLANTSTRAAVLATLAGLVLLCLRRRPAVQHVMWTMVTAGMLLLPLSRPLIPAAYLPLAQPAVFKAIHLGPDLLTANSDGTVLSASLVQVRASALRLDWRSYVAIAYLIGVFFFTARLILGGFLTRRLLRQAHSIRLELRASFSAAVIARTEIQESDRVRIPMATGVVQMRVILPTEWRDWSRNKVRAILAHELAHARRRDPWVALLAAVNRCVFWFHPLAWWLERHLAVLAEHAADDDAMAVSADAESYARTVVEIASRMQGHPHRFIWNSASIGGPLVAHRVRRILDPRTPGSAKRLGRTARIALASSAALLLWVTAAAHFQTAARAETRPGVPETGSRLVGSAAPHQDNASATKYEIAELKFEGDPRLPIAELNQVATSLKQRTYPGTLGDVQEEILERIRAAWQDRGHFKAIVTGDARVLTSSPVSARLAITARVDGGQAYSLGGITFKHNRAISNAAALRAWFPLKDGDLFNRGAIAQGLENLRSAYGDFGYINFSAVPETRFDDKKHLGYLDIDLDEGKQFSISNITFLGGDERVPAGLLRLDMGLLRLKVGDIYTRRLVALFFQEHGDLLPAGSSLDSNVHLQPDEASATVAVTIDFRQPPSQ